MAQEFHISVTPLGAEDEYLVRIEQVALGVPLAQEQVKWPVEDWLVTAQQLMNDPLLSFLQGKEAQATQSSCKLVALGQQLYKALFQGNVRDTWMMAQAHALNERSVLRLRLGLGDTRLLALPWELLHTGSRLLATSTDVAFSRYQLLETQNAPSLQICTGIPLSEQNQPLKILMAIAARRRASAIAGSCEEETLKLKQEAKNLQEELCTPSHMGLPAIQLTLLEQPGREQLRQALEQGQYQIFHYAGDINLGIADSDRPQKLNGDDLARLLVNNGIQMVVLNTCWSAYTTSDAVENSAEGKLVQSLIKGGIPSVLAMVEGRSEAIAQPISERVALTLAGLFYRHLSQGYPIDLSLSQARQELISAYGLNQLYWAFPVLYLHPQFDGFLTGSDGATEIALPDDEDTLLAPGEEEALFTAPHTNKTEGRLFYEEDVLESLTDDESEPPSLSSDDLYYDDEDLADIDDDLESGDPDYEADFALVSDLFSQISQPNSTTDEPVVAVSDSENLLPNVSEIYPSLPENPHDRGAAPPPEPTETSKHGYTLVKSSASCSPPVRFWRGLGWKSGRQGGQGVPFVLPALNAKGIFAIAFGIASLTAFLGLWFLTYRSPRPSDVLVQQEASAPPHQRPRANIQQANFQTPDTKALQAIAIEKFQQGDIESAQVAVEELLNRNALPQASAALAVVPKQQLDTPTINFLRGRLAWQSISAGNKDFRLDDARRLWETAVKKQPKSTLYLNALGFAYYAEGNFDRAVKVWFDALSISEQKQATAVGSATEKEALTTYAGLAMALRKSAQKEPPDKRESLLYEAMKLRQKVMTEDPVQFQPEALSKNWMWSKNAIQDWQALSKIKIDL
ncbi:MAG: CHAT domain-containing protein [Aphanothece sp. CMT-3BRIN-NPC111]|nr:CHAT domain-containing protein [Aphanothece sp. CMT-3BRIN-NPC111]